MLSGLAKGISKLLHKPPLILSQQSMLSLLHSSNANEQVSVHYLRALRKSRTAMLVPLKKAFEKGEARVWLVNLRQ